MANEDRKPLKERLAALREAKQSAHKEAKVRVASAWTLAKSLLPTAPTEVQFKMASALLQNSTKALTAALKQTAINAHYTKIAEKFEQVHKMELNEFLEDESLLSKLQNEVKSELKGEAKNASAECKCSGAGCTKTAAPEDEALEAPMGEEAPAEELPPTEEAPAAEEVPPPADDMPPAEEGAAPAGEAIPDEVKDELQEKIDNLEADVQALEDTIEGEEELDFSQIFNEEDMEDKTDSLANEGEDLMGEESEEEIPVEASGEGFFGSEAIELEGEGHEQVESMESFFHHASVYDTSSMDALLGDAKVAATEAGEKIVERGEMADALLNESGVPDMEEDHDDMVLFEVLKGISPAKYDVGEKREGEPKLEAPKKAGKPTPDATVAKVAAMQRGKKTAAALRSLGNVKPGASKEQSMLANLVFPDETEW